MNCISSELPVLYNWSVSSPYVVIKPVFYLCHSSSLAFEHSYVSFISHRFSIKFCLVHVILFVCGHNIWLGKLPFISLPFGLHTCLNVRMRAKFALFSLWYQLLPIIISVLKYLETKNCLRFLPHVVEFRSFVLFFFVCFLWWSKWFTWG